MKQRLQRIFDLIEPTQSFADVGCDHGFIAKSVIESGKSKRVTISDLSLPSLQKAEKLLKKHILSGEVTSVCCDGLKGVCPDTQTVLIAGMGGEEIIKILTESPFLPPVLILQPMKNVDKVRKKLFELGYGITRDFIFFTKRYYNVIVAKMGQKVMPYNEFEFIFGRDNLSNRTEDFKNYLKREIAITERYAKSVVSLCDLADVNNKLALLKEILNED